MTKHGRKPETVCALYAKAEREGIVQRKSNMHGISPEQYAERLYRDGDRGRDGSDAHRT